MGKSTMTPAAALERVREIALALPEVSERLSHGAPSFFIRGKKTLCNFRHDHHGDGRTALWVPAAPGVQEELIRLEPERFFKPPYVGPSGWFGLLLNVDPDWDEVANILEEAYRHVGPKKLIALLDDPTP